MGLLLMSEGTELMLLLPLMLPLLLLLMLMSDQMNDLTQYFAVSISFLFS